MSELIEAVTSWRLLLVAVVVYGFAPGFLLRIIVRLYPHDDPRRAELVAELYAIPRLWRPFWVAEQLETGLFEGLTARSVARRSRSSTTTTRGWRRARGALTLLGLLMIGAVSMAGAIASLGRVVADGTSVLAAFTTSTIVALVTFVLLSAVRRVLRRRRHSKSLPDNRPSNRT